MNGDLFISRVRNILRDEQSPTDKGEFWTDREIILALNASQSVICNFLVENRAYSALSRLQMAEIYPAQTAGILPNNYMHFISAQVSPQFIAATSGTVSQYKMSLLGSSNVFKTAQVYLGGDSVPYLKVSHTAVFIVGNNVYCQDYIVNQNTTSFVLYYWEKPSYIGATSLADNTRLDFNTVSFPSSVYDIIIEHASAMLGTKEPQTQRDLRFFKAVADQLGLKVTPSYNYIINSDIALKVVKQAAEEK